MSCTLRTVRGLGIIEHEGVAFLPNARMSAAQAEERERESSVLRAEREAAEASSAGRYEWLSHFFLAGRGRV